MVMSKWTQGLGFVFIGAAIGWSGNSILKRTQEKYTQTPYNSSCYFGNESDSNNALFRLSGKVYRLNDFPQSIQSEYKKAQLENYFKISEFSEKLAARVSLSSQSKPSDSDKLTSENLSLPALNPSEIELKDIFDRWVKSGLVPVNSSYESQRDRILNSISGANIQTALTLEIRKLRSENKLVNLLQPPCPEKTELPYEQIGLSSAENSKGKLVYVLDFSCFSCRSEFSEFKTTVEKFKGKIEFAVLPISSIPEKHVATQFARLAYCAQLNGSDIWKIYQISEKFGPKTLDGNSKLDASGADKLNAEFKNLGLSFDELSNCSQNENSLREITKFKTTIEKISENLRPIIFLNGKTIPVRPGTSIEYIINNIFDSN